MALSSLFSSPLRHKIITILPLCSPALITLPALWHHNISPMRHHHRDEKQPKIKNKDRLMRLFESWMDRHGKKYHSLEEKLQRFEVFRDNLEYINETNKKVKGYRLGLNEFADMTRDEFKQKHSGFKIDLPKSGKSSPEFTDKDVKFEALPKAVD